VPIHCAAGQDVHHRRGSLLRRIRHILFRCCITHEFENIMTNIQTFRLEEEALAIDFEFIYDEQPEHKLTQAWARPAAPAGAPAKKGTVDAAVVPANAPSHAAAISAPATTSAEASGSAATPASPAAAVSSTEGSQTAAGATPASTAVDKPATDSSAAVASSSGPAKPDSQEAASTGKETSASGAAAANPKQSVSISLSGPTEIRFENDGRVIQGFCELKHLVGSSSGGVWFDIHHGAVNQRNLNDMAHFEGIGVSFGWFLGS
jgi:hypothetical protein